MADTTYSVLVIDENLATVDYVERSLEDLSVEVVRAADRASGMACFRQLLPNAVFLDSSLDDPKIPLRDMFCSDPAVDIVLMVPDSTHSSVVELAARGASALLTKPLDSDRLRELVLGFIAQAKTRRQTRDLDEELLKSYQFEGLVGRSSAMLQVFSKVRRVAPLFQTVLVTGPTGTGKELVAHAMHRLGPRSEARFVICNCSALVETLLESQLFGHVKGAFTGASHDQQGLFEYANRGTLFLDEIGELPMAAQAKLLRVLQNRELQRVGSPATQKIDVHVIAATNRNLREQVSQGRFREDLFYRLSMIEIQLPPLADRKEDVPLLQRYFLQLYSARYAKQIRGISQRAQVLMSQYPWPGNVRELENAIGNACIMAENGLIVESNLPETILEHRKRPSLSDPGLISFEELQRRHLRYVLDRVDGNKARAAEILGISRATIYDMLSRFPYRLTSGTAV